MNLPLFKKTIISSINTLLNAYDVYKIIEEVEICNGSSRADFVVLGKELIGIEMKSPHDTFIRLENQINAYSYCFDRNILAIPTSKIEGAKGILPSWWGIITVDENNFNNVSWHRKPRKNPQVNIKGLLELLWRDELDQLYTQFVSEKTPPKANRNLLRLKLSEVKNQTNLKIKALHLITNRKTWRTVSMADAPLHYE